LLDHVACDAPLDSDAKLANYDRAAGGAQGPLANEVGKELNVLPAWVEPPMSVIPLVLRQRDKTYPLTSATWSVFRRSADSAAQLTERAAEDTQRYVTLYASEHVSSVVESYVLHFPWKNGELCLKFDMVYSSGK
jgi:hypothetical protein